jgi:hypothetical protein
MHLMSHSQPAHDLRSSPPPEVLDEIAAAWERAQEPPAGALELCFVCEVALDRAWGELRLPSGERMRSIPASEAIAIACGDALIA